jgi:DNA-binding MarR family transcriptional regulator
MKTPHTGAPDAISLGALTVGVSDFVSQGNAILGIRDSGKSYTATYLAEQLLCRDIPFTAFDPIGVWRFLRHGKKRFEVLVAGGEGADIPLTVETAVPILRHAMTNRLPVIFDLYDMALSKADWRRIVEACVRELLYQNKSYGPRHVFIEEAAEFVPQMLQREHAQVYAEIEKLARMGGNAMLGYTLINQRAEQVNKAVLELCDCLLLHRQKGRLSLAALTKWLDFGDKKATAGVIEKMPMLSNGECFVWKGGAERPEFTKIPTKQSFHPNRREQTDPGMATSVEKMMQGLDLRPAKAEKAEKSAPAITAGATAEPERVPVFEQGDIARLETLKREFEETSIRAEKASADALLIVRRLNEALQRAEALTRPRPAPSPAMRREGKPTTYAKGPQKILAVLAARHPKRVTQSQLGTLSGYTPSTMRTYLPELRAAGLIEENADDFGITAAGLAHIGDDVAQMPAGGRPLLEYWCSKLTAGEAAILTALWTMNGTRCTPEMLAEQTGYTDSTLRTYIPTLRRNNLIHPTELKISSEFLK